MLLYAPIYRLIMPSNRFADEPQVAASMLFGYVVLQLCCNDARLQILRNGVINVYEFSL